MGSQKYFALGGLYYKALLNITMAIKIASALTVTCPIVSPFISFAMYFMLYSCKSAIQKNLHKSVYCCIHKCNYMTKNLRDLPLESSYQEFIIKHHQVHTITKLLVLFNVLKHCVWFKLGDAGKRVAKI